MPKTATKKKTAEPSCRSRPAKQRDKHDSFELRDEDEDGLFVNQSPQHQLRAPKRSNGNRSAKPQLSSSRMDDGDGCGNMDFEKCDRSQSRRAAASKRPNKPFDEFEKMIRGQNGEIEMEIKGILARRIESEESFSTTFHTTFASIMSDGFPASGSAGNFHFLGNAVKTALSKAHGLLQQSQSGKLTLSPNTTNAIFTETQENLSLDIQHTERILKVGRLVGEDKINIRLSGIVSIVHDPDYNDASEALFATDDESGMEDETWAREAKDQERIVKRMTAAITHY